MNDRLRRRPIEQARGQPGREQHGEPGEAREFRTGFFRAQAQPAAGVNRDDENSQDREIDDEHEKPIEAPDDE